MIVSLSVLGCSYSGRARPLYSLIPESSDKVPAAVYVDGRTEAIRDLHVESGGTFDIELANAVVLLCRRVIDRSCATAAATAADAELIAKPFLRWQLVSQGPGSNLIFEVTMGMDFRQPGSATSAHVAQAVRRIHYSPPGSAQAYMWATYLSLGILSPITFPLMTDAAGDYAVELAEQRLAELARDVAKSITAEGDLLASAAKGTTEGEREAVAGEPQAAVCGTGFFVSESGHVLTASHVVAEASTIEVRLESGARLPAVVLRTDSANDVALLKVECESKPVTIWQGGPLRRGQEVFTLGYPFPDFQGVEQKLTSGHISALSGIMDDIRFVQVDVAIQPGNSGGPLFDRSGRVVGIVVSRLNARLVQSLTGSLPEGVNYAVKVAYAMPLLERESVVVAVQEPDGGSTDLADLVEQVADSIVMIVAE